MSSFCVAQFWDSNTTWHTNNPDFTPCFQKTVLVWLPAGFLCIFSVLQIHAALKSKVGRIPLTFLGLLQEAITALLIVLNIIQLAFSLKSSGDLFPKLQAVDHAEPAIKFVTFTIALLLQIFTKRKGISTSTVLFIFWFLATLCTLLEFQSVIRGLPSSRNSFQKVYSIIILVSSPLILVELLLNFWADGPPLPNDCAEFKFKQRAEHTGNKPCPQYLSSFPNQFTFQWVLPLLWQGRKKYLEFQDLWDLNAEDKCHNVFKRFKSYWEPEFKLVQKWNEASLKSRKINDSSYEKFTKKTASVLPALLKANAATFLTGLAFKLVSDCLAFVAPFILGLLINHLKDKSEHVWKGYLYMGVIFISVMVQTLFSANNAHRSYLTGMRLKTALVEAIYQKSLVISNVARKESTTGEIVNLMGIDSQRFSDIMLYLNNIFAPLQIALAIYFLWAQLGPSALAGVAVLFLIIPVNIYISQKLKTLKEEQMKYKDKRIRLTNEIFTGIKLLKLYAWEPSFEAKVEEIRQKEMNILRRSAYLDAFMLFLYSTCPSLVSLASFATYVLIDEENVFDEKRAFVSLTLFNIIRFPVAVVPQIVQQIFQARVSLDRLNKFMNADEIRPDAVTHFESDHVVSVENGKFSWDDTPGTPTLHNINLNVKEGSLVAIVGTVGSGKSSLLSAILGEMQIVSGRVNTVGTIAYVSQQSWIQNATLRDNILFGKEFDANFYEQVIDACALKPDIQILAGGDKTEIGEKGINLSGGQKQRVSLARAVYSGAQLYFLDDPLSAVDSHVAKHLFQKVIGPRGLLKNKTRVFVTHGITYLSHVDNIIVMKNGGISESGTYQELLNRKSDFADFLEQHSNNGDKVDSQSEAEAVVSSQGEDASVSGNPGFTRQSSTTSELSQHGPSTSTSIVRTDSTCTIISKMGSIVDNVLEDREDPVEIKSSKLTEAEKVETGNVKRGVFIYYMKSMSWKLVFTSIFFYIFVNGLNLYSNIWLSQWAAVASVNGTQDIDGRRLYLGVYGGLGLGQAIGAYIAGLTTYLGILKGAEFLHRNMLSRLLRSPMYFFDTTPLGRILNRFSKDVDVADYAFPQMIHLWMSSFFQVLSTIIVISIGTPIFLVVMIPIGVVYILVQRFYATSSRQLKRLESVSRSPIYSHFSETLAGTSTIRAFKTQDKFLTVLENIFEKNLSAYFPLMCINRWLAILLESIGNVVVMFAALFALLSGADGASGGLSITYALGATIGLSWLVRLTLDIENNIVAVERLKEYGETPQEAAWEVEERKPDSNWPENGRIVLRNYQSRYRDGLDLVLKGINCCINPGEKIGIVGRTGAGKSSLSLGLFRIVEAAGGSIEIDGKDISQLGLHDVRERLTIIPQDPAIFAGDLRLNLDPLGKFSDDQIWHALEKAHIKPVIEESMGGLDATVSENGENFSLGQRQLVCLARAILRHTKILILDEATAAVDLDTDDLIQKTIRSEFKDCTILTIAHRINTIMDYDRIIVLDKGEVVELDSPEKLLKDSSSCFYSMAKDAELKKIT